jgi:uncharacterized protein YhaN
VDEISRRVLRLAGSESVTYISVEEGYETLARIWVEVEERDAYTSEIEAICNEWEDERAGLEARLDRAVGEVKSVLDQAGARDEIHFREIIEGSLRRQELATRLEQLRLDTPVLTGTDSKDLEHELRATPPERVEAELAELPERIERLHEQLTDLEDNLAEAEVALGMIPPMPDAFPNLVGNQYRAVPGGVGFTPLPNLFAKALRQPHLDAAGRMLAGLMHGKYRSIAPVRDDEDRPIHGFKVIDASGAEVDPLDEETSALYMALRMALIAVTASGAPNLPLLLNDFTGKMDVEATQDATAALLATFANSQIVFVTASESVAGTLKASARGSDDPVHVIDATQSESPWRNVING